MMEAGVGQEAIHDELNAARAMAKWFEDYLFGIHTEIGAMPPLAIERQCELMSAHEVTENDFAVVAERLMQLTGETQTDVAYWLCGYPDKALAMFTSECASANIEAFKQKFSELSVPSPHTPLAPET
jgi:hypothetical protein